MALLLAGSIGFALGIMIRIKKDGQTTTIEVPAGSNARIAADGQVDVELPRTTKDGATTRAPLKTPEGSNVRVQSDGQVNVKLPGQTNPGGDDGKKQAPALSAGPPKMAVLRPQVVSSIDFIETTARIVTVNSTPLTGGTTGMVNLLQLQLTETDQNRLARIKIQGARRGSGDNPFGDRPAAPAANWPSLHLDARGRFSPS